MQGVRAMSGFGAIIAELEDAFQSGVLEKRVDMLQRVTDLLVDGANVYTDEHVALFDDVIGRLSRGIEAKVRAELSNRLAPIANAPLTVIKALGSDDARRYVQFCKTLHVLFDRFRARNPACRTFRPE
jgi:uncharacterized protein (DUF2336 family)